MPRIKASPKKCVKSNLQRPPNSWVFLLKGEALELSEQYTGNGTPDIVTLRHPNSGEAAIFLFSPANNSVQEILSCTDGGKRSWFLDESVKSDGKLHLSTPIDPIFLVLPYLKKHCNTHAQPLEQLLRDDEYPETERLLKSSGLGYLYTIADKKGDEDLQAYKYNESKTLGWLKKKTERVAEILKQKNIHVSSSGVVSSNYTKTLKPDSGEQYLRYAHGIVSEYLPDDLSGKLLKYLGVSVEEPETLKRKSSSLMTGHEMKKPKIGNQDENRVEATSSILDLSKPEPPKPPTFSAKDRARAKAASGSKSISSFFKKT